MEKPKDKPPGGIMPNGPFRSTEHGGDFVVHTPADETFPEVFPAEVIHFRRPSVKEWKRYMDFLIKKSGTDDIKDFIKKYEAKKEWGEYVKSAIEKIETLEKKRS